MMLKDLNTPFENKRIVMYGVDHNKAVYHNRAMQQIRDNIYRGVDDKDPGRSWIDCDIYVYYPDFKIGLAVGHMDIEETVEVVLKMCHENQVETAEDFVAMIEDRIERGAFVGNTQIELIKHLSPGLVDKCIVARHNYIETKEQLRKEREEKERAEEQEYVQQKNQKAEQSVADAIDILKNDGRLINSTVYFYKSRYHSSSYSIINHIARLYGVIIPLKTQGWINSSLLEITIKNGKMTNGRMSGKNQSTTIFKYMNMLIDAVRNSEL